MFIVIISPLNSTTSILTFWYSNETRQYSLTNVQVKLIKGMNPQKRFTSHQFNDDNSSHFNSPFWWIISLGVLDHYNWASWRLLQEKRANHSVQLADPLKRTSTRICSSGELRRDVPMSNETDIPLQTNVRGPVKLLISFFNNMGYLLVNGKWTDSLFTTQYIPLGLFEVVWRGYLDSSRGGIEQ